jgi:O-acetyl-ADP-ribose deacetylase (regulator of RNase III)
MATHSALGGERLYCPWAEYMNTKCIRSHLFQDLQPYVCTYPNCAAGDQLYRSRRDWLEHERAHRRLWQCPIHVQAVYDSKAALERHFKADHPDEIGQAQLKLVISAAETSADDLREKCPVCLIDATMQGGLPNHLANHLERFALFSLPRDILLSDEKDEDDNHSGKSNAASEGRRADSESNTTAEASEASSAEPKKPTATISTEELAACEQEADAAAHRIDSLISMLPDRQDSTALTQNLVAIKSNLKAIRNLMEIAEGPATAAIDEISGDLAMTTRSLRRSLKTFGRRFGFQEDRSQQRRPPEVLWRDLDIHFEREGLGIVARFELYRVFIQCLYYVLEGEEYVFGQHIAQYVANLQRDGIDSEFLARQRHLLQGLARSEDVTGSSDKASDTPHRSVPSVAEDQSKGLSAKREPPSEEPRVGTPMMMTSHWATKVFDQNCPRTRMEPLPTTQFFGQPDPNAIQQLIADGFDELLLVRLTIIDARVRFYHRSSDQASHILISQKNRGSDSVTYYTKSIKELGLMRSGSGLTLKCRNPSTMTPTAGPERTWTYLSCSLYERMIILFHMMSALKAQDSSIVREPWTSKDVIAEQDEGTLFTGEVEDSDGGGHVFRLISKVSGANPRIELYATSGPMNNRVILCAFVEWDIHKDGWARAIDERTVRFNVLRPHVFVPDSWYRNPDEGPFEFRFTSDIAGALMASLDYIRQNQQPTTTQPPPDVDTQGERSTTKSSAAAFVQGMATRASEAGVTGHGPEEVVGPSGIPTVSQLHSQWYFLPPAERLARPSAALNEKVSLISHDITKLEVDAIVNSAHYDLEPTAEGTTNVAIVNAAGPELRHDLRRIGWCDQGTAVLTKAYKLPCKAVIHTVGPTGRPNANKDRVLQNAYLACLRQATENGLRSIAFPAIATGNHAYPEDRAARLAAAAVRRFLSSDEGHEIDRVVFCVYSARTKAAYDEAIP